MSRIIDTWADSDAPITLELYYSAGWHDITDDLHESGVQITRRDVRDGPGEMTCKLDNTSGTYSPDHPMSPLYGLVGRNTPIRAKVTLNSVTYTRFVGEVATWAGNWTKRGNAYVEIAAAGETRRIGQGDSPLASVYRRAYTTPDAPVPGLRAYWPCTDAAGADQLSSALPTYPPLRITGTAATLAGDSGSFTASEPLIKLGADTKLAGSIPYYADTGEWQLMLLLGLPSAGVGSTTRLAQIITTGTAQRWTISIQTNGYLLLEVTDSTGAALITPTALAIDVRGDSMRVYLSAALDGSDTDWTISALPVGSSSTGYASGTITSTAAGRPNWIALAPDAQLADTVLGHIGIQDEVTSIFYLYTQLAGYIGELADARIDRLAGEAGLSCTTSGDQAAPLGVQQIASLLDLLAAAADADAGYLLEARGTDGLTYRTRDDTCAQAAALALTHDESLLSPFKPSPDDKLTRNRVVITSTSGGEATYELTTGRMSTAAPPDGVGIYETKKTLNLPSSGFALPHAAWRVHEGTCPEPRWPGTSIDLAHPTVRADTDLAADILGVDIGDRITVTGLPDSLPPDDVDQIVDSYSETISPTRYTITWSWVPYAPRRVHQWATAGSLRGSWGSTLATETTWSQVTLDGASCRSLAGDNVTEDLEVIVLVALTDYTSGSEQVLAAKYVNSGNQRSWAFDIDSSGRPHYYWSADGSSYSTASATVIPSLSDGVEYYLKVTHDVDNDAGGNDVKWWQSTDGVTWSQIGATVTGGSTTSIYSGTADYQLGARSGTSVTSPATGVIKGVWVHDGIDSTTDLVTPEPDDWTDGYGGSGTGATTALQATSQLSVATVAPPYWGHGDGNYQLIAAGKRWTVTAVDQSTSSPQVLTATPVDNGVEKTIAADEPIALAAPTYWSLS